MNKKHFLFVFSILFVIGVFFHYPMLKLGLTGDHLEAINEWRVRFIVPSVASFRAFINPYGASAFLDKIIDWIWGFNPLPYFLISLITKVLAATSAYFLSQYLFKSKIIASIVSFSALLLFCGTEANAPGSTIYISLFLLCLGFMRLFQQYDGKVLEHRILSSLYVSFCFIASFAITPARMYGLLPMVLLAELFAIGTKKTTLKFASLRLFLFFASVFFFKKIGLIDSYGTASGVATAVTSLSFYQSTPNLPGLLFFMLGSYRQVFIPDIVGIGIAHLGSLIGIKSSLMYALGLFPAVGLFLLSRRDKKIPKFWSVILLLSQSVILVGIMQFLSHEIIYAQLDVFLGGLVANTLFLLLLALIYRKSRLTLSAISFFGTPLIFMVVPYLLYRFTTQETISRYFAPSTFMGALILGYVLYFVRKQNLRVGTIFMVITVITIFYNGVLIHNYYASSGEAGAYNNYLTTTFNVMNRELGNRHGKPKPIVYIKGDDYTYLSIFLNQGSLRFSLVNDTYADNAQPLFLTDKQLVKQIYLGTAPIPYRKVSDINAFYGFEIINKRAIPITGEIREYLLTEAH